MRRRTLLGGVALLLLGAVVGVGVGQAFRDTTPPSLWVEGPDRVAAGEAFALRISADEPVSYTVRYQDQTAVRVEQDLTVRLEARAGAGVVAIEASDGAGNVTTARHEVQGVAIPSGALGVSGGDRPGAPFTATLRFDPPDAEVRGAGLTIDGRAAALHDAADGRIAFGAVPLTTAAGAITFEASWTDGFGRPGDHRLIVPHGPLPQEVEELRLSAATLSVITPEGRELEAAAIAAARADPTDPPRWTEPFVLPIEGRGTSGFARPRRYAAGGPVSFHLGEDIAAPTGTPIRATNDGLVVLAGHYPIKGGLTIVDHGAGVTSRYYHQSAIVVGAGEVVRRGQTIGEVGSTGLSTGPHLHWEMRVDGEPSDPLAWVERSRP